MDIESQLTTCSDATNDAAKASAPAAINGAAAPSHGRREAGDPSVHPNATNGAQVGPSHQHLFYNSIVFENSGLLLFLLWCPWGTQGPA